MSNAAEVQVTVKGKGFTADFYTTLNLDTVTYVVAFKGPVAADRWLSTEAAFAKAKGLTERPFVESHLALISANGTETAKPVWVAAWDKSEA